MKRIKEMRELVDILRDIEKAYHAIPKGMEKLAMTMTDREELENARAGDKEAIKKAKETWDNMAWLAEEAAARGNDYADAMTRLVDFVRAHPSALSTLGDSDEG